MAKGFLCNLKYRFYPDIALRLIYRQDRNDIIQYFLRHQSASSVRLRLYSDIALGYDLDE